MQYTWDRNKAAGNLKKHGVTFEEAATVFEDDNADIREDRTHAERINVIGWSARARLLFVVSVEVTDNVMRIISARRATRSEARRYHDDE